MAALRAQVQAGIRSEFKIGCVCKLRGGERLAGVEVFFISGDPICGDVSLCLAQAESSAADHAMQVIFQLILYVGVPSGAGVRFGPEIADIV